MNPNGIHILDASGHYATVNASLQAAAVALQNQFGTWSVNEVDKTITYRVDGALFPNVEGVTAKLPDSLSGDELKLDTALGQNVLRRIKQ